MYSLLMAYIFFKIAVIILEYYSYRLKLILNPAYPWYLNTFPVLEIFI